MNEATGAGMGARIERGFAFDRLLDRLPMRVVSEVIGAPLIAVLELLDPELTSEDRLRRLAREMADAAQLLSDSYFRGQLIDALPVSKARELAARFNVDGDPLTTLFPRLSTAISRADDLSELFGFLGVAPDERAKGRRRLSTSEVEAGYPLFEHQRKAAAEVLSNLEHHPRRTVLHMPTGAGKTRTAMHVVCAHLRARGPTLVVWLASSPELLDQAADEFQRAWANLGDRQVSLVKNWGEYRPSLDGLRDGLLVGGLQKLYALSARDPNGILALGDRTTLTVVDEAHQAIAPTYREVIDSIATKHPNGRLLGLTATPGRTWADVAADEALSDFFGRSKVMLEVAGYENPVEYLMAEGYLARPTFHTLNAEAGISLSDADRRSLASALEIPDAMLDALAESEQRNLKIVRAVEDLATRHQRIVVFAASVEHAKLIRAILSVRGLEAHYVTGEMDRGAREAAIRRYKGSAAHPIIMCNFGVLTTGFDAPKTSAAVIARPTRSLVLYSQMVGRATRGLRAKGNATAEIVTVVDPDLPGFGDVADAFGNWEDVWDD